MILDPGFDLTLRPMKYPQFYEMYKNGIKNTWTVDEVDLSTDITDLRTKLKPAEQHLIKRLIAFFATGDNIVANNLVLNLYKHINSPEARMYLSRQLFEEALHIQFYLNLLDTYLPNEQERYEAFKAIERIPSIKHKGDFCFKWIDSIQQLERIKSNDDKRAFLLNLICFASCIEGLFFFAAFAYVYYLRSKGLLHGLATGTNWVFRDECYIKGTQLLTEKGWVNFEDLTENEKVAQFDMETQEIDFVKPSRYIKNEIDEDVVEFRNQKGGIHQVVTKNHDVVQKWTYQKVFSKQKAVDFKVNGKKTFAVSGFKNTGREELTAIERFRIAFQADGSMRTDRYDGSRSGAVPALFSFSKERKILRFRDLIHKLGFDYSESLQEERGNREAQKIFRVKVPLDIELDNNLSWVDIENVSYKWCQEFVEELSHWDSHVPSKSEGAINPGDYIYYSSTNESNVDMIQAIAAIGGMHCTKTKQEDDRSETYNTVYRAYIHEKTVVGGNTLIKETKPYKGMVYCVTVPKGCIVIRYNDKVCISGNSCHMDAAFEVIDIARKEQPSLFTSGLESQVKKMIEEAIESEMIFTQDCLDLGVAGLSAKDMKTYLQFVGDQRLMALGYKPIWNKRNPFSFMELQDVQELTNFFERRVAAYQTNVSGNVSFDEDF